MTPCLELSIVVWLRYIALKPHGRIRESDVKEGSSFHTFQLFYKNLKILVLIYVLSQFIPIFKKIDEKFTQIYRS